MLTPAATGYMNLARIVRAHGRKGEVIVRPCDGLPFLLSVGMQVWLTPPELRRSSCVVVQSVRPSTRGMIVSFEGIDTIDAVEHLVSKLCLGRQSDIDMTAVACAPVSVLGATVISHEVGKLGTIGEVLQTKAHDVWVVDTPAGEVLLPICDEVISAHDIEQALNRQFERSLDEYDASDISTRNISEDDTDTLGSSSFSHRCTSSTDLCKHIDEGESDKVSDVDGASCDLLNVSSVDMQYEYASSNRKQGMKNNLPELVFHVRLIPGLLTNEQFAALSYLNHHPKDAL